MTRRAPKKDPSSTDPTPLATTATGAGATPRRARRRGGKPSGGKHGSEPRMRIRAREQRAVTLSDQGWTQEAIAQDLGITQSAVSQILRRVDERMASEIGAQRQRHRARIFRRLDHVSREASAAWEHSKAGRTTRTQTKRQDASGVPVITQQVTVEERSNPSLLEEVRRAEEAKARLLGFGRSGDRGVTPETSPALPPVFTLTLGDERTAPRRSEEGPGESS
jgi:transcriptional regulator with XRE-family HTH domain